MCDYEKEKTCCFIGHRDIHETDRLRKAIYSLVEDLIVKKGVCTFLFGSKSAFNDLCLGIVSRLKEVYPSIRRIYVRSSYPVIDEAYKAYLLEGFEDTCYPKHLEGAGRFSYVERNYDMIRKSGYCVFYYDKSYVPLRRSQRRSDFDLPGDAPKSGTRAAYLFAQKDRRCHILNVYDLAEGE